MPRSIGLLLALTLLLALVFAPPALPARAAACAEPSVPGTTLHAVTPETPARAVAYGAGGVVDVLVTLDRESRVVNAAIAHSPDPLFDAAALDSARTSTFRTAIRNCEPVAATFVFRVEFRVPPQPSAVNAYAFLPGQWSCRRGAAATPETYERDAAGRIVHAVNGTPVEIFALDDYHVWHVSAPDGTEIATALPWTFPRWTVHAGSARTDYERVDDATFDRTTYAPGAVLTRCRRAGATK